MNAVDLRFEQFRLAIKSIKAKLKEQEPSLRKRSKEVRRRKDVGI